MTSHMDVKEVLEEILELGFFSYEKNINSGYPNLIAPKFTVHVDRINLFYKFMLDYIKNNINIEQRIYINRYKISVYKIYNKYLFIL